MGLAGRREENRRRGVCVCVSHQSLTIPDAWGKQAVGLGVLWRPGQGAGGTQRRLGHKD